ncbi:alpha/beta hydrolase-fold protein [Marinicella sp. S1101]|uniref:alpha/beta hydrolase family esterase n=1 Tax=Marinicella marina TaxID=2996016 RepID=UPI002260D557|nr:alpha/beta hydrolase-fold protein [Marinicella marina]MCX7554047.1 alpha/beta hydrolase-fold protein [Marinicella marina]MDJ1140539.1 alpha/beta hydrolase-fold protein [Marinicella marina]
MLGLLTPVLASVPSLNQCPEVIFTNGIDSRSVPSNGTGGVYPGAGSRTINSNNTYYYYVPSGYQVNQAMPLLVVWHGAAGAGNAGFAAADMRDFWQAAAEQNNFIVVAQAATGASGGWIPNTDAARLVDIINDVDARYNIETSRKYIWGFSAGGFVAHAIALNNADYFAAYAVSGAHLGYAISAGYPPSAASRQLPVFISVGQSDSHFPAAQNDLNLFAASAWQLNQNLWFDAFVGGHELLLDLPEKAWYKICNSVNSN